MPVSFPDLPYPVAALEPHVSAQTLEFHHGKHHKGYVNKLNAAIDGTRYADMPLEKIIREAYAASDTAVFNNAAQAWNHDFLWHSMAPAGGGIPTGTLADAIGRQFGDMDTFRAEFKKAALGRFGSGWTWLVSSADKLEIVTTGNADTPLTENLTPLLTLDVWEHAYYLDYQNRRSEYVDTFINSLINWKFAAENFESRRAAA